MSEAPTRRLDVSSQEFARHAYERYAELRDESPVIRLLQPDGTEIWLITRYADARAALADPRLSKDARKNGGRALVNAHFVPPGTEPQGRGGPGMLFADPPDHDRLRRLVSKAFTPRRIARLEPRIDAITRDLLDGLEARARASADGVVDLMAHFALPLPVTVICELLGVPPEDREAIRYWTNEMLVTDQAGVDQEGLPRPEGTMWAYLGRVAMGRAPEVRRDLPEDEQPNLLDALLVVSDDTERLSPHELVEMLMLLLIAGHETTVNLIGNGTYALLRHPDQLRMLRERPQLLPGAIEEFLRYDGPIEQATFRHSLEPVPVGDVVIPADRVVGIVLGSADHDPSRFASPETFDLTRPPSAHVAFGHGIHFCLGAPLARLEGRIAFGRLLERFPDLSLAVPAETLRYRAAGHLSRGLATLPVHLTAH